MSYYPTERRGGCMESISRCCRHAYVYPLDTRKLLYATGGVVGIILVAVVWSGLSSGSSPPQPDQFRGSSVLLESPLVVGCNFFPSNLRDLVHNNVSKVKFNENLSNDSVFGGAACTSCQTDLPRLKSGLVRSQIWSINVPCPSMYKDAVALTLEQVDAVSRLISSYPTNLTLIKSSSDVNAAFRSGQVGGMLAVSSGHSIDGRLPVLRTLHSLGVRVMAVTSNCSNSWATSYNSKTDNGLSDFGKALVKEMNRIGMLIDVSDASHQTQLDTLNVSRTPIIFSHAAAYTLVNDSRNIRDDVLDKLKANKGVLMVTFAQQYISNNISNDTILNVVDHLNYIKNKVGVDGVGIGSEFDATGLTYPPTLKDVSTFPVLFDLLGKTWKEEELKKLAGGNIVRVLQTVEKYAVDSASLPVDETYQLQTNSACYSDYPRHDEPARSTVVPTTVPTTKPTSAETTAAKPTTTPTTAPVKSTTKTPKTTTEAPKITQASTTTEPPPTPT